MTHHASPEFWACYWRLDRAVRDLADKNFGLLNENPSHPSLHFKQVGRFLSVRVGRSYRALGVNSEDGVIWFWIGTHAEYDRLTR